MDLALYARVIWRFRFIVLAGFLLALSLSLFSLARVSLKGGSPSLTYRQAEIWQSAAKLNVGSRGDFPRAFIPASVNPAVASNGSIVAASPTGLAVQLIPYANSDA